MAHWSSTAIVASAAVLAVVAGALAARGVVQPRSIPTAITTSSDTLNVAIGSDILGTAPGVRRDENTDIVMMHVFEGLVGLRENGTPGLLLASKVDVAPDGRRYRFDLRQGLRFSDGSLVTPADVVRSWRWYLDPANSWLCLAGFDGSTGAKVQAVRASGPGSVDFILDRADPMLMSRMAGPECGGSAIFAARSLGSGGNWRSPISTGPYQLESWQRGEYLTLTANPYYRSRGGAGDGYTGGKTAATPKIKFHIIRDGAARLAALLKGQLDVLPSLTAAETRQLNRAPGISISSAPVAAINAVLIQTDDALLRDIRLRRALAMALDLKAITGLSTAGAGTPNSSIVPVASPNHGKAQDLGYANDLDVARRLLAAAHYDGQPITLVTNRRYADQFDQALLVQAMARAVGINIRLEVVDWATQLALYQSGKYQLMSFAYSARAEPFASYTSMLGDRSVSKRKVWGDPAAIALLRTLGETVEPNRRKAILDDLHRRMIADVPLIVLYNNSDANALRSGITGFSSWMMARARFWNVSKAGG